MGGGGGGGGGGSATPLRKKRLETSPIPSWPLCYHPGSLSRPMRNQVGPDLIRNEFQVNAVVPVGRQLKVARVIRFKFTHTVTWTTGT